MEKARWDVTEGTVELEVGEGENFRATSTLNPANRVLNLSSGNWLDGRIEIDSGSAMRDVERCVERCERIVCGDWVDVLEGRRGRRRRMSISLLHVLV